MKDFFMQISLASPLIYHMSGKFEAPSESWIHKDFDLTDFELIIMTSGTLYIEYNNTPFAVHTGEYLLLPPLPAPDNRRRGVKPSFCSFYWIHFMSSAPHQLFAPPPKEKASKYSETSLDVSGKNSIRLPLYANAPNPAKFTALMKQLQSNVRDGRCQLALNYETSALLCELYAQLAANEPKNSKLTQKQQAYAKADLL